MPATALRCRICETEFPLDPVGVCSRCFGPLEPIYAADRTVTHAEIEAGPPNIWRYAPLLPVAPPAEARLAPGNTPLVSAPRLASAVGVGELLLKLDTANPTHSFKDRVVAVACAKALELGYTTPRAPGPATSPTPSPHARRRGNRVPPSSPGRPRAGEAHRHRCLRRDDLRRNGTYDDCSRLSVELSFELDWAFVNVELRADYAEGSKTLAFEIAEQLGWELPDAVVAPIASGAMYSKVHQGFGELLQLGLVEGARPRIFGGQAEGCAPVAHAFADGGAKVKPVGRTRSRARSRSAPRPTATSPSPPRSASGGSIYAIPEEEIPENIKLLAETTGVFGETAPATALGALREAVRRGELGENDRVVLLVTGDGLKTPALVADTFEPVLVEPDADLILERLGVHV